MLKNLMIAAFTALTLFVSPVFAAQCETQTLPKNFIEIAKAADYEKANLTLSGERLLSFFAAFREVTGTQTPNADELLIFLNKEKGAVLLSTILDGCIDASVVIPVAVYFRIAQKAAGVVVNE